VAENGFKDRLDRIAGELPHNVLKGIQSMPFDKWVIMSLMQKACRRGQVDLVGRAALTLWQQDKRALWRRLAMIAAEDCAVGDIETVLDVIVAAQSPAAWRKTVGDAALGVHLAQRMAKAAKTRYLTELYLYSELSRKTAKAREWAAKASFKELASILHDPSKEAHEQALALFALFGSKRFETKNFQRPNGDVAAAVKIVKEMPVPCDLLSVCTSTLGTPHFPLAMLLPVGWLQMQRQAQNLTIRKETNVSSPEINGLPMYAVDGMYTRTGIASIKELKEAVPALAGYSNVAIGEGFFFIEAEALNPRLTCPAWDDFRRDSIFAVMQSLGLEDDDYLALNRALIKNYDIYNDIRIAKVEAMPDTTPDMFAEAK
jgi:hypothetical protein